MKITCVCELALAESGTSKRKTEDFGFLRLYFDFARECLSHTCSVFVIEMCRGEDAGCIRFGAVLLAQV